MLEVQYHPADIRAQVRYFFLRPPAVRRLALGALVGLVLLGFGLASLPNGVRAVVLRLHLRAAEREHRAELRALEGAAQRLAQARRRLAGSQRLHARLGLLWGLPGTEGFAGGLDEPPNSEASSEELLASAEDLAARAANLDAEARGLETLVDRQRELAAAQPSVCPLPEGSFALSSPFGPRRSPFTTERSFHSGIDLAAPAGTPVSATGAGTVVFAGRIPLARDVAWWRMGNCVVIDHAGHHLTIYGHLQEIRIPTGARVRRGEAIGTVGSTGWSTSPHLHYEVRRVLEGTGEPLPLDPRIFILNHDWQEWETVLAARRAPPPPDFDPLPTLLTRR